MVTASNQLHDKINSKLQRAALIRRGIQLSRHLGEVFDVAKPYQFHVACPSQTLVSNRTCPSTQLRSAARWSQPLMWLGKTLLRLSAACLRYVDIVGAAGRGSGPPRRASAASSTSSLFDGEQGWIDLLATRIAIHLTPGRQHEIGLHTVPRAAVRAQFPVNRLTVSIGSRSRVASLTSRLPPFRGVRSMRRAISWQLTVC